MDRYVFGGHFLLRAGVLDGGEVAGAAETDLSLIHI